MTHQLIVKETNNKNQKYHYQVVDESGNIISERRSNREYVACTIDGNYYYGRLDLVGKGEYRKYGLSTPIAYLQSALEAEAEHNYFKSHPELNP
jgi:hypothetical protein